MSRFREKLLTDGRTDGQILFQTTLPATAEGPIKRTCSKSTTTITFVRQTTVLNPAKTQDLRAIGTVSATNANSALT